MYRIILAIAVYIVGCIDAQASIPRWDALPAINVVHLQGPYAGKEVCPMCQHGYDAGLLVFLPSTTTPETARGVASQLREAAASVADSRFRPFLILTGAAPSAALLQAVQGASTNWYVAHLPDVALAKASNDFQTNLATQAVGYVFAQRRMLWRFDPATSPAAWQPGLDSYSRYAMAFLRANYEVAIASKDPVVPKGNLWAAPNQLSSAADLGGADSLSVRACLAVYQRPAEAPALVALARDGNARRGRVAWATTDDEGCVSLSGVSRKSIVPFQLFQPLQPVLDAHIDIGASSSSDVANIQPNRTDGQSANGSERIVGLPCEGCDAVFRGMPNTLESAASIAGGGEPGERMTVTGVVLNPAGMAQAGTVVYAYQTDAQGSYPREPDNGGTATGHGRLRAWAMTDDGGRYSFQTIRPGAYPDRTTPQHIHMHVIEPGRCTYYLGDLMFNDDPRMTKSISDHEDSAYGGSGVVDPVGDPDAGWHAVRNIQLGLNVPDYLDCEHNTASSTELPDHQIGDGNAVAVTVRPVE
ncbi:MAG: hypothetical protein WBP11_01245 [Dokdonella sp.]